MDKIAVLIPCYNEEKTIKKVVLDFKKELPEAKIYVYNNNSTDNTVKEAIEAGAIIGFETKQGKGNVIRTMFREIDAQCYIITDGDDTYSAKHANEMVKAVLENKVDMVIGDRLSSTYFKQNKRLFHNLGNRLVRKLINYIYKSNIRDVMTGYRAFSYSFVKTFPVLSKGFEIETEMTIHSLDKNLSIQNVIVEYKDRPEGSKSKLKTYSDGFKVIKTIVTLYKNYKPLQFFTWLAFFLFLVACVFLIPVLIEYVKTGLVPKIPSFISSVFFAICAIESIFVGLTLDTIIKKGKQDFEIKYIEYSDKLKKEIKINKLKGI